jgi:hypothetical protein
MNQSFVYNFICQIRVDTDFHLMYYTAIAFTLQVAACWLYVDTGRSGRQEPCGY